jgi:hypothetical protein
MQRRLSQERTKSVARVEARNNCMMRSAYILVMVVAGCGVDRGVWETGSDFGLLSQII